MPVRARGMDASSRRDSFNHSNTFSISRINPPKFGGGLKFEPDPRGIGSAFHRSGAEIEQKGAFFNGLGISHDP